MKKLAYQRLDGQISIVTPVPKETLERALGPMTPEEYRAHVIERSIPPNTDYFEINDKDIPTDRIFRDAWVLSSNQIVEDTTKSRELIRSRRNKLLYELDKKALTESRKPDGQLATIDAIAQQLRDLPTTPDFLSDDIPTLKNLLLNTIKLVTDL